MQSIKELRDKIDKIDADIIKKLAKRKELVIKIGKIKLQQKQNIVDNTREKQLVLLYEKLSTEYNLQPAFVKKLFKLIITNSRKLQK